MALFYFVTKNGDSDLYLLQCYFLTVEPFILLSLRSPRFLNFSWRLLVNGSVFAGPLSSGREEVPRLKKVFQILYVA